MITLDDLKKDPIVQKYLNYCAEDDPNGSIGHYIADSFGRKYGHIPNIELMLDELRKEQSSKDVDLLDIL